MRDRAANRLGVWILTCESCQSTFRGETGLALTIGRSLTDNLDTDCTRLCTLACLMEHVKNLGASLDRTNRPLLFAYRWNAAHNQYAQIGVRGERHWNWNDTGEARWIEENAARLRGNGEIS